MGHCIIQFCLSFDSIKVFQRRTTQKAADDAQGHWLVDDGTHFASQL